MEKIKNCFAVLASSDEEAVRRTEGEIILREADKPNVVSPQKHGRLAFLGASAILPVSSPQRFTSSATGGVSALRPSVFCFAKSTSLVRGMQ